MAESRSSAHSVPTPLGGGWAHNTTWATGLGSGSAFPSITSRVSSPGSRQALCLWLPTFELRLELVA